MPHVKHAGKTPLLTFVESDKSWLYLAINFFKFFFSPPQSSGTCLQGSEESAANEV